MGESFQDRDVGEGVLTAGLGDRHFLAVIRMPSDGQVNIETVRIYPAPDQDTVNFFEAPGLEGLDQVLMGQIVFGHDQAAAGVFIEPVDDARSFDSPDSG